MPQPLPELPGEGKDPHHPPQVLPTEQGSHIHPSLSHSCSGSFQGTAFPSWMHPACSPWALPIPDSPLGVPGHSLGQAGDNRPQGRPQDHAVARGAPWGMKHRGGFGEVSQQEKSRECQAQPFPAAPEWLFPLPAQHSHTDGAPGALPWGCPSWGSPGPVSQVIGNWRSGSCSRPDSPDSWIHQYGRSPNRNLRAGRAAAVGETARGQDLGMEEAAGGQDP